ncbi:MAG: YceK/YidQ family lipoprotein, partial [Enterobacteriaceae bacterium]
MRAMLLLSLLAGNGILVSGCASIMSHSGPYQGYYPGVRSNAEALQHEQTGWAMTPLLVLDMPLSAVADTLLLPYDAYRSDKEQQSSSPKERIKAV